MEDEELVRLAAGGDQLAFEVLVRRHAPAAWRLARTLLSDDFAADEAVQDTFMKASRALTSFRGESSFETWLLSICRRTFIDRLRLKRPEIVSLDEARQLRAYESQAWLRVALSRALAGLEGVEREAFTLVDVLGHTREEAAQIAGVPSSTMRSRVARARTQLADALRDEGESAEQ